MTINYYDKPIFMEYLNTVYFKGHPVTIAEKAIHDFAKVS